MAATLSRDQEELAFFSFPITKQEETETVNPVDNTPDIIIWGKATDGTIDGDQEIVDPAWSAKAIQQWFDTKANIRMSHDPKRPVGKGIDIALTDDGHWVKSKICDPLAKHFVREGILNDYSVGISNPAFKYRDAKLDPSGRARRIITGHDDGSSRISEITICDRGSNFNSKFQLAKAAADGSCEFVGKMLGDEDEIAKAAPATLVKARHSAPVDDDDAPVTVTVPKGANITFSPADLSKLLEHRRVAEEREDEALKAVASAETAITKRDIDTATRRRLASQGRALSDGSYPIETHEDAGNAVTLALSGHGNVSAAKALIRRIARKEGWQDILDRLDGKKDAAKQARKSKNRQAPSGAEGTAMAAIEAPETVKEDAAAGPTINVSLSGETDPAELAKAIKDKLTPPVASAGIVKADGDDDADALHHDDGDDDDTDSDADAMDKGAEVEAEKAAEPTVTKPPKVKCPNCKAKVKASAKFCPSCGKPMGASKADDPADTAEKTVKPTPGEGVTGAAEAQIEPAPEHREPDGPAIEALEHDAHLPTTPDSEKMQARVAALHKSLGVPHGDGWLHDLLCPAYDPATAKAAHPLADLSMLDEGAWQAKALDMAATAPLDDARAASLMWQCAITVKHIPGDLADELRQEAHKAFRDANPGPGSAPTPGECVASRFNRPYITAGHAAPSPGHDGPHSDPVHAEHVSASEFQRGPLTSGHAADSPGNANPRPTPIPAPEVPGVPTRTYYTRLQRDNARQAMASMHDHIAMTFPDLCPMHGPGRMGQPADGARPVPVGVGGPVPHGASTKAATTEEAATEPQETTVKAADGDGAEDREVLIAKAAKLERKLRKARRAAGLEVEVTGEPVTLEKAAGATGILDADLIKTAAAEAISPLVASLQADLAAARQQITEQGELLTKQAKQLKEIRKTADAIADQPDPNVTAYRGVALAGLPKTSSPAGMPTVAQRAEHAQASVFNAMVETWRSDPDPGRREEAYQVLKSMTGLNGGTHMT